MGTPRSGFKSGGGASGGGSGDVTGPASSTDHAVVRFDGAGGKTLQDSGVTIDDSDNVTGVTTLNKLTLTEPATGATITVADGVTLTVSNDTTLTGDPIGGSTGATDNAILRANGTGGATVQASAVTIDDTTGAITVPAGSTASTPYLKAAGASGGIYGDSNLTKISSTSGSVQLVVSNGTTAVRSIGLGSDPDSPDGYITTIGKDAGSIPIFRAGSGNNGAGAPGNFGCKFPFEANTATSGSPNALDRAESRTVFTNEGATAKNYHTLPAPFQGYEYTFICQDSDGIRITAASGDTIRVIDKVTAAAGYIETTTIGSVVRLVALNAAEWFAVAIHGTWTDGTFTYDDTSLTTP